MVDINDILEDEDSGVSNFTTFDLLQQPSKFKEELEKQYKVEDDLIEQSKQNYVDQFGRLANYPKTIDLGDPTGIGIFRTPEEREATSVSLSPAYKAGADFFYTIGNKFPDIIDNNKYAQLSGSLRAASGTAKWKDVHEIFGKMEMGKDITPMEGGTALLSLADFSFMGSLFTKAPKALEPVSNYLKRLGVPEKEVTTKALKVITENPQHIDEYAGSLDITELSDEAYDKLNLNAAVPPRGKKKKQAPAVATKEQSFPGGLPLKDFDESLLKTKTVKDAPPLKPKAATLTDEVKTKIGKKLEQTNFSKLDVKGENPYLKIVNEERAAAGYSPTNTPVSMHAKNLQKQGYITKEKQVEITNHSKKRSQTQANEAYTQKQLFQNTAKADKAVRLAKELQEGSESPIVMPMATFYDQLVKAFPDDFRPLTSDSSKRKIITTLKVLKPEINNYLAKSGKEVGGLKYSDETLGVIEGGKEAARRTALVKKFKQTFPDEPITPLDDPLTDLSPLGEDVFDPRILDLKAADKSGQVDIISNPKYKFYEFLRDSLPTTDLDTLFDTVKIGDAGDLANPAQKLFNQFKQIEDVRKKVSPLIRPFLQRIFPVESTSKTGKNIASVQIAHTFEKTKMKPPKREGVKKEIGYDP